MDHTLIALLDRARERAAHADELIVALTGAGISAESGIPTFRGEEGYWTVGSTVYQPQELATHAAFSRMPDEVWRWYLYRRGVCRGAAPNPAHHALVRLEQHLGERFRLITQNVDGLHLRAGSSAERTYQIHGNIDFMRCAAACTAQAWPIPALPAQADEDAERSAALMASALVCPRCGGPTRPHILWFDECYDEARYRWQSAIDAAMRAALVLIVGTSASTNLPWQVVQIAAERGAVLIDINIEDNPFAEIAGGLDSGYAARGAAAELLPAMVERLVA